MINPSIVSAGGSMSGFKNYTPTVTFSTTVTGQALAAGAFVSFTATTTLSNTNSVSQVQVQYTGLESFYRIIDGNTINDYPSFAAPNYEIGTMPYFSGSTLTVYGYIADQAGGSTFPTITFNCNASLFLAPF